MEFSIERNLWIFFIKLDKLFTLKDPQNLSSFRQEGYLYDKEAILEYILKKKKENARKQKEYEKQKNREKVTYRCFTWRNLLCIL